MLKIRIRIEKPVEPELVATRVMAGYRLWDYVCPVCGMGLAREYFYCPYCGAKLNWENAGKCYYNL